MFYSHTVCKSQLPTARQPSDVSREASPDMVDGGSVSGAKQESRVHVTAGGLAKERTGGRDKSSRGHTKYLGGPQLRDMGEAGVPSLSFTIS